MLESEVLFTEKQGKNGSLGIITLNRKDALNALNHEMIQAITSHLKKWQGEEIKAVVICAKGRAFCAGGDLKQTYDRIRNRDPQMIDFFRDEYQLNRLIYHYGKPYIALLNGITMGGGAGISIHGSHRVATDNLLFAMPETGIGFFPDVGGTYFLSRLRNSIGIYLGLTGARINADDCITLGIATHRVDEKNLSAIVDTLAETDFGNNGHAAVTDILNQFNIDSKKTTIVEHENEIEMCFKEPSLQKINDTLNYSQGKLCQEAFKLLQTKSPTSLMVTLQALQNARLLNFDACMRQEFRLVNRFLLGHDFIGRIRAVLIDKDQQPKWSPRTLEAIESKDINAYFEPLAVELS